MLLPAVGKLEKIVCLDYHISCVQISRDLLEAFIELHWLFPFNLDFSW